MKVVRVSADAGFTKVPNPAVRDERLSWKARGLHHYLLSHITDGWTETADTLADKSPDGRHAVRTGLQELVRLGYVHYRKHQIKGGQWVTDMVVFDVPPENPRAEPESGNPTSDNPAAGKPDANQNTTQKTNQKNKEAEQTSEEDQSVSDRAATLEAARYLRDRYGSGLTDPMVRSVIREAHARANRSGKPIRNLVPYLEGWAEGNLADVVSAAMEAMPEAPQVAPEPEVEYEPPAPPPTWYQPPPEPEPTEEERERQREETERLLAPIRAKLR